MPTGEKVPDKIKNSIISFVMENEKITGPELKRVIEAKHKGYHFTERTYQNIKADHIEEVKRAQANPIDRPWSLGALPEFDFSSEAISCIFKVQAHLKKETNGFSKESIRQARWVARLHSVVKDVSKLSEYSMLYTVLEIEWEITDKQEGNPFDTSKYDEMILTEVINPSEALKDHEIADQAYKRMMALINNEKF